MGEIQSLRRVARRVLPLATTTLPATKRPKEDAVETRRKALIGIVGLYLLGLGMLAGAVVERMRFDHKRADMFARYDEALREWHAFRMELEKVVNQH